MSLRHSPDFSGALAQFGTDATPREQRDLENERKLREQRGTTFSQFAQAEADQVQGRFAAHEKSNVVGSAPIPAYPAGPNWSTDPGSQCIEPPLSYDNPALDENSAGTADDGGEDRRSSTQFSAEARITGERIEPPQRHFLLQVY